MDIRQEKLAKRAPITSEEIGRKMQQAMGIEGKVMVHQIRGGQVVFSVKLTDLRTLYEYLGTVPGYQDIYLSGEEKKGPYVEVTVASFFKLRLLAHLFLNDVEKRDTIAIADLIDKLTGVDAEARQLEYLNGILKDFHWDADLFMMFHQEAMFGSHVRKLVQAHSIVYMQNHKEKFRPPKVVKLVTGEQFGVREKALPFVVEVVAQDCLVAAHELLRDAKTVCVLNMANQFHPGGGYAHGSGAQEEDLCRRSDLLKSLNPKCYIEKGVGIGEFGVLYSPGITVFRAGQNEGYAVYEPAQWFKVNVISSAAYNLGKPNAPGFKNPYSPDYEEGMKRKIRGQLRAAKEHGDTHLVLSAFGCGAFRNDPQRVSQFYLEVLSEIEFETAFKIVQFAIIPNPSDTVNDNFTHFQNTFKDQGLTREELRTYDHAL